ncbi:MAG: PIN domain-containing protein [Deltaproteobacteria bacterium]|nr:PIN domain-containing protein [Deltaproteobacteria bacterium]
MFDEPHLIDTNILVYAYETGSEKRHQCVEIINGSIDSGNGVLSIQNILEFSSVVTEKVRAPLDPIAAGRIVRDFSLIFRIIGYNTGTAVNALKSMLLYKTHFFDALLVATMEENNIFLLITENDRDFKNVPWLKTLNPFKRGA